MISNLPLARETLFTGIRRKQCDRNRVDSFYEFGHAARSEETLKVLPADVICTEQKVVKWPL